jgi:hypothetical protein
MSFGFSVGDFLQVGALALQVGRLKGSLRKAL